MCTIHLLAASQSVKVEDIHTKENMQTTVLQNLEVRCRKLTEQLQEVTNNLEDFCQLINTQAPENVYSIVETGKCEEPAGAQHSDRSPSEEDCFRMGEKLNRKKLLLSPEVKPNTVFDNTEHIRYSYWGNSDGWRNRQLEDMSVRASRKRNVSEMSSPEIAINFEKENLLNAENCDYMVMENLIQRRYEDGQGNESVFHAFSETCLNSSPRNTFRRSESARDPNSAFRDCVAYNKVYCYLLPFSTLL
ncbi:hypothetical protein NQ318_009988 [Aromia moschata]|uniref:Uncharacterized protein n=1 Tax=Aromia moschata TaxID=1265417 RepID=A0AAV8YA35_9CUCU|nr:hypothetical protein NQ318_009988 [Aromia moschata]